MIKYYNSVVLVSLKALKNNIELISKINNPGESEIEIITSSIIEYQLILSTEKEKSNNSGIRKYIDCLPELLNTVEAIRLAYKNKNR